MTVKIVTDNSKFCFVLNESFFLSFFIFGCVGSSFSVRELSLVAASGGHSSSRCMGLSLSWPLLLQSTSSRRTGSVVVGPVAPRHVGSSQTRARTCVPCISRQILNHCATREAPNSKFYVCLFVLPEQMEGWSCHLLRWGSLKEPQVRRE